MTDDMKKWAKAVFNAATSHLSDESGPFLDVPFCLRDAAKLGYIPYMSSDEYLDLFEVSYDIRADVVTVEPYPACHHWLIINAAGECWPHVQRGTLEEVISVGDDMHAKVLAAWNARDIQGVLEALLQLAQWKATQSKL